MKTTGRLLTVAFALLALVAAVLTLALWTDRPMTAQMVQRPGPQTVQPADLAELQKRVIAIDDRLTQLDQKISTLDQKSDVLDQKIGQVQQKLEDMHHLLKNMERGR